MNAFEDLQWRGAVENATPGAEAVLAKEKITVYCGFDPTANTLHVGHLIPIMGLVRLQRQGHTPIAVVGGGTGMIGDPSFRAEERPLLSREQIHANVDVFRTQLDRFLDFESPANPARIVDNADWLLELSAVDFMREVGKHFSINRMLGREAVRNRIAREDGLSYTEFSYPLLQAYDFYILNERYGCKMQIGGSDQWGNLVAGVDFIRRMSGAEVQALVYPLLTTATGEKFGKSIGGAPALDPAQTSPYRLYQFLLNSDDADVVKYLKIFTLLDRRQIGELESAVAEDPRARDAQRTLAREVTRMVHGETGLAAAERASEVLFGGDIEGIDADQLLEIFADVPSSEVARDTLQGEGVALARLLVDAGITRSAGEARRLAEQGGLYLNSRRITDPAAAITAGQAVDGRVLVFRRGARNYHLIELV